MTAARLLEVLMAKLGQHSDHAVVAYWYKVRDGRDQLADQVRNLAGALPVVPLVLRGGFENPNRVMSDLRQLILDNQSSFDRFQSHGIPRPRPMALLLLSRAPFTIEPISSPTVLPEWFPIESGNNIYIWIEDLFWSAEGRLQCPESRVEDICEKLYHIDNVLVKRISAVYKKDHNLCSSFYDRIRIASREGQKGNFAKPAERIQDFLDVAASFLSEEVKNTKSFRPSAREAKSMTGRIMRLVTKSSPDELSQCANSLVRALDLPPSLPPPDDSIVTVLLRSTNPMNGSAERVARNLIVTVHAAAQFVTAAAHSDSYPSYPITVLQSLSLNLRQVLDKLAEYLETLPDIVSDETESARGQS